MNTKIRKILVSIAKRKKRKLNSEDPFDNDKIISGQDISTYHSNVLFRARCIFQPFINKKLKKEECISLMRRYFEAEVIQEDDTTLVFDVEGNPPIRTIQMDIENDIFKDYFFCK